MSLVKELENACPEGDRYEYPSATYDQKSLL